MTIWPRKRRLRTTIIAWAFIPAAIILGMVALAHFVSFQHLTEDLVSERNRDLALLLANQYAGEINELAQPLRALASDPDIISADPTRQQRVLNAARDELWSFDAGVITLSAEGQITAADSRVLRLVGLDWSTRQVFVTLAQRQALTVSNISMDGVFSTTVIVLAVPVLDGEGAFKGGVAGMFAVGMAQARITDFYGAIKKLALDTTGVTYLVDGAGQVIFHPEYRLIGTSRAEQTVVGRVLQGETGTLRSETRTGQAIIASYAPVPQTPWGVIVEEDWHTLAAASTPYQRWLLALLVLGLIVPVAVIALGVRRITGPVHDLIHAAQAVAGGDFSRRITARGTDEIEELAEQFNRMAAQLQDSYATLEQRVEDRTRELAALNAITAVASRSLDIEEVLRAALDKTLDVTGMAVGAAYRLDAQGQALHLIAQRGLPPEFVECAAILPRADSVAGRVAEDAQPALQRLEDYPASWLKRVLERSGVRLALSIPLVAKGRILGFINLGSQEVREVPAEELNLMASIGQQVGVAVENAQLYEQAEEAAAAAERSRLARELHDAVSQTLFSASMIAAVLPRLWERDQGMAREQLAQLHQLTQGAQAEMRILLLELRPDALVETALDDLLRQLAQATGSRAMVPVEVDTAGACDPPQEVKVALYRIAQEALNNVVKHADAEHVTLSLNCEEDAIMLNVWDDGRGFDPQDAPRERLGLRGMRERAAAIGASLNVTSAKGQGTHVTCHWRASEAG